MHFIFISGVYKMLRFNVKSKYNKYSCYDFGAFERKSPQGLSNDNPADV